MEFFRPKLDIQKELASITKPVRVLYISTYIPRKCGIATFTKDLTNALNMINPQYLAEIMAMDNHVSQVIEYPHEVKFRVQEDSLEDYLKIADYINHTDAYDLICLQHEYGIFGQNDGENILKFLDIVKKPVITTLHTVLSEPNSHRKEVIQKVCQQSLFVVVMLKAAADILVDVYDVDRNKIAVIHHGVPDFPMFSVEEWKKKLDLEGRVVMSSINLLSDAKGIEFALQSLPEIIEQIPNFLYLVVGETHPGYLRYMKGHDKYREKLIQMTKVLKICRHVKFINRYLPLSELVSYIGASDYYVTPYPNAQQAASGALAYAIGAGKICISTPYLYAKEMLAQDRGVLVPFNDSEAIAQAVIHLNKDTREKLDHEIKTYAIGRTMTWVNIAHQYFHLFNFASNGYLYQH